MSTFCACRWPWRPGASAVPGIDRLAEKRLVTSCSVAAGAGEVPVRHQQGPRTKDPSPHCRALPCQSEGLAPLPGSPAGPWAGAAPRRVLIRAELRKVRGSVEARIGTRRRVGASRVAHDRRAGPSSDRVAVLTEASQPEPEDGATGQLCAYFFLSPKPIERTRRGRSHCAIIFCAGASAGTRSLSEGRARKGPFYGPSTPRSGRSSGAPERIKPARTGGKSGVCV